MQAVRNFAVYAGLVGSLVLFVGLASCGRASARKRTQREAEEPVDSGVRTTARDDGSAAGRDGPASVDGGTAGGNGGTAGGNWRRSGWKWRHGKAGTRQAGMAQRVWMAVRQAGRGRWGWPSERGWRYASRGRPIRWGWPGERGWRYGGRRRRPSGGRPGGDAAGVASMVVIVDETTDQFRCL